MVLPVPWIMPEYCRGQYTCGGCGHKIEIVAFSEVELLPEIECCVCGWAALAEWYEEWDDG